MPIEMKIKDWTIGEFVAYVTGKHKVMGFIVHSKKRGRVSATVYLKSDCKKQKKARINNE